MQRFKQIISNLPERQQQILLRKKSKGWWTPVWKGLTADIDGKHRKAMGASLWTYLYLLTFVNRKTGIVSRRQEIIAEETGLPLRTVQRHLKQLSAKKYITLQKPQTYSQIQIEKWKLFKHTNSDEHKISQ